MNLFVRRGQTVKGPFSNAQLRQLLQQKKLLKTDFISQYADGPWDPIDKALKKLRQSRGQPVRTAVSKIQKFEIKRTFLGNYEIHYNCPECEFGLKSTESEIGIVDECPECGGQFILDSSIANDVTTDRESRVLQKQKLADEKQIASEEAKRLKAAARTAEQAAAKIRHDVPSTDRPGDGDLSANRTDSGASNTAVVANIDHGDELSCARRGDVVSRPASNRRCWYCTGDCGPAITIQCPYCRMIF